VKIIKETAYYTPVMKFTVKLYLAGYTSY